MMTIDNIIDWVMWMVYIIWRTENKSSAFVILEQVDTE